MFISLLRNVQANPTSVVWLSAVILYPFHLFFMVTEILRDVVHMSCLCIDQHPELESKFIRVKFT